MARALLGAHLLQVQNSFLAGPGFLQGRLFDGQER
jgi:hypothetical protein